MLLLFLLGIAALLSFTGPIHLSVKGKLISSTFLLLKNVSGPYPKNSSTTSVTPAFPHLFTLMASPTGKANLIVSYFFANSSLSD